VREYLQALDASNPVHEGGAKYLSPIDPAAAPGTPRKGAVGSDTSITIWWIPITPS
jgi:hypothetical protein